MNLLFFSALIEWQWLFDDINLFFDVAKEYSDDQSFCVGMGILYARWEVLCGDQICVSSCCCFVL
jgi:hypothetical protein